MKSSNGPGSPVGDVKKRKAVKEGSSKPSQPAKKQKQDSKPTAAEIGVKKPPGDDDGVIVINRAPVLELFAASVAQVLHPSIPWTTCLSIGGAISTISAISKGRAIGKMDKPDPGDARDKKQKRLEDQADLENVSLMGFDLHIKDGNAMVGDKPRESNEDALVKKFGPQNYERVRRAFATALATWKGRKDELNKAAFHMYEDMRPVVPPGQKG